jgi:hypothetical protein
VKILLRMKSEDLPFWKHFAITLILLAIVTAVVVTFVGINFASGEAFGVILNITGGVAGKEISSRNH